MQVVNKPISHTECCNQSMTRKLKGEHGALHLGYREVPDTFPELSEGLLRLSKPQHLGQDEHAAVSISML